MQGTLEEDKHTHITEQNRSDHFDSYTFIAFLVKLAPKHNPFCSPAVYNETFLVDNSLEYFTNSFYLYLPTSGCTYDSP